MLPPLLRYWAEAGMHMGQGWARIWGRQLPSQHLLSVFYFSSFPLFWFSFERHWGILCGHVLTTPSALYPKEVPASGPRPHVLQVTSSIFPLGDTADGAGARPRLTDEPHLQSPTFNHLSFGIVIQLQDAGRALPVPSQCQWLSTTMPLSSQGPGTPELWSQPPARHLWTLTAGSLRQQLPWPESRRGWGGVHTSAS